MIVVVRSAKYGQPQFLVRLY